MNGNTFFMASRTCRTWFSSRLILGMNSGFTNMTSVHMWAIWCVNLVTTIVFVLEWKLFQFSCYVISSTCMCVPVCVHGLGSYGGAFLMRRVVDGVEAAVTTLCWNIARMPSRLYLHRSIVIRARDICKLFFLSTTHRSNASAKFTLHLQKPKERNMCD